MSLVLEIEPPSRSLLPATTRGPMEQYAIHTNESTELLARFITGDDEAFTLLYKRHHRKFYAYCVKMLCNAAEAEDALHTVWEKTIRLRATPQKIDNAEAFIYRLARNECLDRLKRGKRTTSLELIAETDHPHTERAELSSDQEIVIRALDQLTPETKEMLVLHYYSGYSFDEIAAMLGKKSNAVWTRVSRARAELKTIVEKELRKADTI